MCRAIVFVVLLVTLLTSVAISGDIVIPLRTLSIGSNRIKAAALSPDGKLLACCESRDICLYDVKNGMRIGVLRGHTNDVLCVRFSPKGDLLASGDNGKKIRLWSAKSKSTLKVFDGHTARITDVGFSPDGKSLVSCSTYRTNNFNELRFWDIKSGDWTYLVRTVKPRYPSCLSVCSNGKLIAAGEYSGGVGLYEQTKIGVRERFTPEQSSGIPQGVFMRHDKQQVTSVKFSSDGRMLLSASLDNTIRCWDTETGRERLTIQGPSDKSGFAGAEFVAADKRIVSATKKGKLQVWDASNGKLLEEIRESRQHLLRLAISSDASILATYGSLGTIDLWSVNDGK